MPNEAVKTYWFLICIQYHTKASILLEIEIIVAQCLLHSSSARDTLFSNAHNTYKKSLLRTL